MDLFGRKRIAQLEESLETQKRLFDIQQQGWKEMEYRWNKLQRDIAVANRAIGRLIAKIDPAYLDDPHDPSVRARSDAISDEVIRKMLGEHLASNKLDPSR